MRSSIQITGLLLIVLSSCQSKLYNTPATRAVSVKRLIPPAGMVYIPSGTFQYKLQDDDKSEKRNVSVSAFFIDKTEVTNKQYQAFVNWVADSVAITDYLHDDSFYLPSTGATVGKNRKEIRLIDWDKVHKISPLWKRAPADVKEKLAGMMTMLMASVCPTRH